MRTLSAIVVMLVLTAVGVWAGLAYCNWMFAAVHGPVWWMWMHAVVDFLLILGLPFRFVLWVIKLTEKP